jgi:hypothetical protein
MIGKKFVSAPDANGNEISGAARSRGFNAVNSFII